jgi:hypothetical protein
MLLLAGNFVSVGMEISMASLQGNMLELTNVPADKFLLSVTLQYCVIRYWIYVGHSDKENKLAC